MAGPPLIRAAVPTDVPAVAALLAATWQATYDRWLGPEHVRQITAEWHSHERLAAQVGQPGTAFLLAEIAGGLAGTGFAHMVDGTAAEIGRLYVLPAHQGHGIGSRLLAALMAALPDATRFHLEVEPRNHRAIAFYRRHCFAVAGATADCGQQQSGIAALVMARDRSGAASRTGSPQRSLGVHSADTT